MTVGLGNERCRRWVCADNVATVTRCALAFSGLQHCAMRIPRPSPSLREP